MRALIYSESRRGKPVFGRIGARRWECEWYELTAAARKRYDADPHYEHDHDRDEVTRVEVFPTKDAAVAHAKTVAGDSVYGCAIVQEHVLDWFVEEDRVADWEPVGKQFEVTVHNDGNAEVREI
jgi:hypothetical protein